MRVPFALFLMSFAAAMFSYGLTGTVDSAPVMLALLSAVAALILMLRARGAPQVPKTAPRSIVVDGSNIMHWTAKLRSWPRYKRWSAR